MLTLIGPLAVALVLAASSPSHAQNSAATSGDAVCLATPVLSPIAAAVRPAVVSIRSTPHSGPLQGYLGEWLELQWGERDPEGLRERLARGLRNRAVAAGVIVDPAGLVLTSAQVLRLFREVQIVTADGQAHPATVVGMDERSDIALLRLPARSSPYPYAPLAHPDSVQVGDWVLAYGAPFGLDFSVSAGIVSAINRDIPGEGEPAGFLQTDAPLSAGNTGGPLVNMRGEVVGIAAGPGFPGVGFAVSPGVVRAAYDGLRTRGYVSRAWLGVAVQPLGPELAAAVRLPEARRGVLIIEVAPDGPAARADVRRGDVLLALNDAVIGEPGDLDRALARRRPEDIVRVRLWRDGRERALRFPLGEEQPVIDLATEPPVRGFGLEVAPITPDMGVVIIRVLPGSTAEKNGVRRGDVVRELDGQPIATLQAFKNAVKASRAARPFLALLQRGLTAVYVALRPD
jgi:serine protease Do